MAIELWGISYMDVKRALMNTHIYIYINLLYLHAYGKDKSRYAVQFKKNSS